MYMPKKTKLKARRKIRQKTRKYRKYGGTPPRLAESKKTWQLFFRVYKQVKTKVDPIYKKCMSI